MSKRAVKWNAGASGRGMVMDLYLPSPEHYRDQIKEACKRLSIKPGAKINETANKLFEAIRRAK